MLPVLPLLYVRQEPVLCCWLLDDCCWLQEQHLAWFRQVLLQEQPLALRSTALEQFCLLGLLMQQVLPQPLPLQPQFLLVCLLVPPQPQLLQQG
jgi:hypothetical protein